MSFWSSLTSAVKEAAESARAVVNDIEKQIDEAVGVKPPPAAAAPPAAPAEQPQQSQPQPHQPEPQVQPASSQPADAPGDDKSTGAAFTPASGKKKKLGLGLKVGGDSERKQSTDDAPAQDEPEPHSLSQPPETETQEPRSQESRSLSQPPETETQEQEQQEQEQQEREQERLPPNTDNAWLEEQIPDDAFVLASPPPQQQSAIALATIDDVNQQPAADISSYTIADSSSSDDEEPISESAQQQQQVEQPPIIAEEPTAVAEEPLVVAEEPLVVAEEPPAVAEEPPVVAEEPPVAVEQPRPEAPPKIEISADIVQQLREVLPDLSDRLLSDGQSEGEGGLHWTQDTTLTQSVLQRLQQLVEGAESAKVKLELEISSTAAQHERRAREHAVRNEAKRKQLEDLRGEMDKMETKQVAQASKIQGLAAKDDELAATVRDTEREIENVKSRKAALEKQAAEARSYDEVFRESMQQLRDSAAAGAAESAQLAAEIKKLELRLAADRETLAQLEKERETEQSMREQRLAELRTKAEAAIEAAKSEIARTVRKHERSAEAAETDLQRRHAELLTQLARIQQRQTETEEAHLQRIAQLKQQIRDSETATQDREMDQSGVTHPLLGIVSALEEEISSESYAYLMRENELRDEIAQLESTVHAGAAELKQAEENVRQTRVDLASSKSRRGLTEGKLMQVRTEVGALQRSNTQLQLDVQRLESELQAASQRLAELRETATQEEDTRSKRMQVLADKIRDILSRVSERRKERDECMQQIAALRQTLASMSAAMTAQSPLRPPLMSSTASPSPGSLFSVSQQQNQQQLAANPLFVGVGPMMITSLQRELRQRQARRTSVRELLENWENERMQLQHDIAAARTQCDETEEQLRKAEAMKREGDALVERFKVTLELLGEWEEKVEDIQADLADARENLATMMP